MFYVDIQSQETESFTYWNFVSSSRDKIENAKQRWKAQASTPVPNETGFVSPPS